MGNTKTTNSSSQQYTPTAAEQQMQNLQLQQYQQLQPYQTQMQQSAYGLGNQLLNSFGDPNGNMWQSLIGGVTPQQQQTMIDEQQRYLNPQFQAQGIYDSGLAATSKLRAATDLSNQNAQFNVGAMQNALNLALSGQAQIQQPMQGMTSLLGQQLAGLRGVSGQSSSRSNPFLNSFYSSLGSSLGSGSFGQPPGGSGGGGGSAATAMQFANVMGCWVASEIFGGWYEPRTVAARNYVNLIGPKWFKDFYIKHGEKIAKFISNKPVLKNMLRPLFEYFAKRGGYAYSN